MKDGAKVLWCCSSLVWCILGIPSLHVLVFILKTCHCCFFGEEEGYRMQVLCLRCLVPRPSHRPVFDCLQYTKTEGEGLSIFSCEWCQYLPGIYRGGEGSPIERMSLRPYLVVSAISTRVLRMFAKRKTYRSWFKTKNTAKCVLLMGDPSPTLST